MLQFMLLFLEVVLLLGMAYIFWSTRKMVGEATTEGAGALSQAGWTSEQKSASQMAQDVAQLVMELQSVAGATRDDIVRQRTELENVLNQAETVAGELRVHLEQAVAVSYNAITEDAEPEEARAEQAEEADNNSVVLDIVCSAHRFGEYLQASGCTQDVITVATDYAQEFILWYTGQFEDNEPIPQKISEQHIEDFLTHLQAHQYDPGVIKRRSIALKAYTNWMNSAQADADKSGGQLPSNNQQLSDKTVGPGSQKAADTQVPEDSPVVLDSSPGTGVDMPPMPAVNGKRQEKSTEVGIGAERQQAVFALAEAGLDQLTIASKTGIEQDAVRLMLMIGQPAYATP